MCVQDCGVWTAMYLNCDVFLTAIYMNCDVFDYERWFSLKQLQIVKSYISMGLMVSYLNMEQLQKEQLKGIKKPNHKYYRQQNHISTSFLNYKFF